DGAGGQFGRAQGVARSLTVPRRWAMLKPGLGFRTFEEGEFDVEISTFELDGGRCDRRGNGWRGRGRCAATIVARPGWGKAGGFSQRHPGVFQWIPGGG